MIPGFGLTMGLTLAYLTIIVLLPILALILKAAGLTLAEYWAIVASPRAVATYRLTLSSALYATAINAVIGLLLAWVLVNYDFPGRRLLDGFVDLPFALPTAVAGISLTALLAPNGWIGQLAAPFGIKIAYTQLGIVIAMIFTSIPFVVRTVQPVLEDMDPEAEEAAIMLGASDWQVFARVIFPTILPAFLAGSALSFARCLGEFGAIIFIAGNLPMQTEITALLAVIRVEEFEYEAAAALASVMLAAAFVMLFVSNGVQLWHLRYVRGSR
ncbi:sulfate transport system permease protein [Dongia mobilis]|uniref:Sulfate transport system permease protein CysT n=1 Tax=Dongia mobilis TaxID=578943 RepID=A0A4R6WYM8_9PROT|nr:sulfate transport system permease protein [Dongia mobilis]